MENEKTPDRKPEVRIPPKRGQIKVKMFKQLAKTVMSVVTLGKKGGSGSGRIPPKKGQIKVKMFKQLAKTVMSVVTLGKKGGSGSGNPASTAPHPINYSSEGHSDA